MSWEFTKYIPDSKDANTAAKVWNQYVGSGGYEAHKNSQVSIFMAGFYRGMAWARYRYSLDTYSLEELATEVLRRSKELSKEIGRLEKEQENG